MPCLRPRGTDRGPCLLGVRTAFPQARLGRARRDRDLGGDAPGRCGGDRRRRHRRREPRWDRHHQPARDRRRMGPRVRGAGPQRPRLAGPPDGGALRRASRGRSRGPRAGADRARDRPLLLGHEDRVAPAKRRGGAQCRLRHDRLLAHLQAHRPPRHRLLERVADDALRHPEACLGRGAVCPPRCRSGLTARAGSVRRRLRHHKGVRRRGARGRHRRRPAGRPVRTALCPAGAGEEHVRDRKLRPAEHGHRGAGAGGGAAHDGGLGNPGQDRLRPGGSRLRHRRGRPVAA